MPAAHSHHSVWHTPGHTCTDISSWVRVHNRAALIGSSTSWPHWKVVFARARGLSQPCRLGSWLHRPACLPSVGLTFETRMHTLKFVSSASCGVDCVPAGETSRDSREPWQGEAAEPRTSTHADIVRAGGTGAAHTLPHAERQAAYPAPVATSEPPIPPSLADSP